MNKGNFNKGHKPWNAGMKGIHLSPATEFKKGETAGDKHPQWKGGEQMMSRDCVYVFTSSNNRIRRPRKVYEDAYGTIPKGWILYHLDKDKHNDDLENLIAIPRAILMLINSERITATYEEIIEAVEQFKKSKDGEF